MSKKSKPIAKLPKCQRNEPEELNNLLYMIHTTPVIDHIGLGSIATETLKDPVLSKVQAYIRNGANKIPKHEDPKVIVLMGVGSPPWILQKSGSPLYFPPP